MRACAGIFWIAWLVAILLTLFTAVIAGGHTGEVPSHPSNVAGHNILRMSSVMAEAGEPISGQSNTKSVPKAFFLSLLVPGTGQFYAQAPGRGRVFLGTELAILAGFLGFRLYSDWKEEDYQLHAATHAGVNPWGKSKSYFEDVSLFMSMEEYNRRQLINFREDAQLYSGADFWEWDSQASRRKFDSLYRASTNAEDNSILMTGVGLLNHLLSAVDAARTAKAYNKKYASSPSPVQFTFKVKPFPGSSMVMVGLKKRF
ncbi:MAG: hypothetical protein AMJ92_01855 [candidate division Zixibacteria bacterium SM23_81]|nr:MAG: hypothetical protein AMJ92_01855 [candidate division Zixibacteria bacterium SM23_81]